VLVFRATQHRRDGLESVPGDDHTGRVARVAHDDEPRRRRDECGEFLGVREEIILACRVQYLKKGVKKGMKKGVKKGMKKGGKGGRRRRRGRCLFNLFLHWSLKTQPFLNCTHSYRLLFSF
jgi:hypothetical protein